MSKESISQASKNRILDAHEEFKRQCEKVEQQYPYSNRSNRVGNNVQQSLYNMGFHGARATFFQVVIAECGKNAWLLWRSIGDDGDTDVTKESRMYIDVSPSNGEPFDGELISR